jgi:hypothetical protein
VDAALTNVRDQSRGLVVFQAEEDAPVACPIPNWAVDLVEEEFESEETWKTHAQHSYGSLQSISNPSVCV